MAKRKNTQKTSQDDAKDQVAEDGGLQDQSGGVGQGWQGDGQDIHGRWVLVRLVHEL